MMTRGRFLLILTLLMGIELSASSQDAPGSESLAPVSASSELRLNLESAPTPTTAPAASAPVEIDAHGKGISQLFDLANQAYEADDIERAVAYYRAIEERGLVNGHLYFNMGNAYFRMGDFGRAILYYEKARVLHPRDRDLLHNLAYTRTFLIDRESDGDRLPGSLETLLILHRQTTRNETFLLLGFLNLALVLCLLARQMRWRLTRKVYFGYLQGAITVLFVLQAASAGFKIWDEDRVREGIILEDSVKATASPGSAEALYELNSGTKVTLLETRDGYSRISWNDTPGFIPEGTLGKI